MYSKKSHNEQVLRFIIETDWSDIPLEVQHQAKRAFLDTLGAMFAGFTTPVGNIVKAFALEQLPGDQVFIPASEVTASASGVALTCGFAANALDIDDGYRSIKGHPGACIIPILCATGQLVPNLTGEQFLTALVVGYEVAIRAGLLRHATSTDYHSSGSWGAIGGAAAAGKLLGLDKNTLRNAISTAEYHAPIAPMMKCIEVPSMGKDSIGWGCMVAMISVLLAEKGFTGINPFFDDTPEPLWISSLGEEWEILNIYFKPYACCRWAQPAIDGTLKLMRANQLKPEAIKEIRVYTFKESAALSTNPPKTTEEAQYNIAFPVAAAALDGEFGPNQVLPPRIFDDDIRRMMSKISIASQERFQNSFPDRAESEVEILTISGDVLNSSRMAARWDVGPTYPTDKELEEKFLKLAALLLGKKWSKEAAKAIWVMDDHFNLKSILGHRNY